MPYDPVHQGQLYLRRAGQLLRGYGVRSFPEVDYSRQRLEGEAHQRFYDTGARQIAKLASDIEAFTGSTLEGRRALDFGCGVGRLALPLAERCAHVYGLDVMPDALREAERNAAERKLTNLEWMGAEHLEELSGRYDAVISIWVFQHIPSREGERIFATILQGLRPGGVGAIHFTIRPDRPLSGLIRWRRSGKSARDLIPRPDWGHTYMLINSYSLNRLGRLLADAGITVWHVKWHTRFKAMTNRRPYEAATLIFRKQAGSPNGEVSDAGDEALGA